MSISKLFLSRTHTSELVTFGEAAYAPGGTCGPRIQSDFQLVMITEGFGLRTAGSLQTKLVPGCCALSRPGEQETWRFGIQGSCRHLWVSVHPDALSPSLANRLAMSKTLRSDQLTIQSYVLSGLLNSGPNLSSALAIVCFETFLEEPTRPKHPVVDVACKFINQQIHNHLEVTTIAAHAFVSPQHLTRLFKVHLGCTPGRYIWGIRTVRGIELLKHTGLGVSEISIQLGFQSPFHFSRLVREQSGMSPSELRRQYWAGGETQPGETFGE